MGKALGIGDVVARVQEGLREALDAAGPGVPVLERVELTIRTVAKRTAALGIEVTVPLLEVDLGVGGELREQETRTVTLTLTPSASRAPDAPRAFADDVVSELSSAVDSVREGLAASAAGDPSLSLRKATATLAFAVDTTGKLTLLGKRGTENATTHTVELVFGSPAPGEGS